MLSPRCSCGGAEQTPAHLFTTCPETAAARRRFLPNLRTGRDFEAMARSKDDAGRMARWLLRLGKLQQFGLAEQLRVEEGDREEEADVSGALTRGISSRRLKTAAAGSEGGGAELASLV